MSILFSPKTSQKTEKRGFSSKKICLFIHFFDKKAFFCCEICPRAPQTALPLPYSFPVFSSHGLPVVGLFFRQDFGTDRGYASSAAMRAGYPYIKIRARVATQFWGSD